VSASDRREGIIDAAKDDARAAVDQLLDAIGRILLAHLDAHETTPPPTVAGSFWTPEEDALLRAHHPEGGPAGVQAAGVNRTSAAIKERARKLNLTRHYRWTPAEDELIERHYPRGGLKAVRAAGVKRDADAIYARAMRLGVKRTYAREEPTTPPQTLTQRLLATLVERDDADLLLDAEDLTSAEQTALRKLRRDNLATQVAPGLYRPTLKGIAQQRSAA